MKLSIWPINIYYVHDKHVFILRIKCNNKLYGPLRVGNRWFFAWGKIAYRPLGVGID